MKKSLLVTMFLAMSGYASAQTPTFACLPSNPFTVEYLNVVGARAWGWKCVDSRDGKTYIHTIVRLKSFYVPAACKASIDSIMMRYRDRTLTENLNTINAAAIGCTKLPAVGTPERTLFDSVRYQITDKVMTAPIN